MDIMLVLSDLMFLCFEAVRMFYAPIDLKQNISLLLTLRNILILDMHGRGVISG